MTTFSDVRLTRHALDVMRSRDVEPEEVADVLRTPEIVEPHKGDRRFVRGPLAVVVRDLADGTALVLTVLLRSGARWTDADARAREQRPAPRPTPRPTAHL